MELFGHRAHLIELGDVGADGEEMPDARFARTVDYALQIVMEVWEVEMAMAINEHR
jgi:hypothetical protein